MLRATTIKAVSLNLGPAGQAVLVQDGPTWNHLLRFKCISPLKLDGQHIIAIQDDAGQGPLAGAFGRLLELDQKQWVVIMASPELSALLAAGEGLQGERR